MMCMLVSCSTALCQRPEFQPNKYNSKEDIFKAIDDMNQIGKDTHTGKAITAVSQYFDASRGGRPDLRQMLVVLTDGKSHDKVKGPADALRVKGVVIYAIGVMEANTDPAAGDQRVT